MSNFFLYILAELIVVAVLVLPGTYSKCPKTASAIAPAVSRSVLIWLISFAKAIGSAEGWVRKEGYR